MKASPHADGVWCTLEKHVQLFFASLVGSAQATINTYKWALAKHYEQQAFGPAPWVRIGPYAHPAAPSIAAYVKAVRDAGSKPKSAEPMPSQLLVDLVAFFMGEASHHREAV